MKRLIALLLLLLLATPCWSQEIGRGLKREMNREMRDVPKRKVFDKKFWLATAFVVGTTILDAETTARCKRNSGCSENNPIYGRNPSRTKLYGIKGSFAAFSIWSTWWWKRDDMRRMERYEFRNDPRTPEPRLWQKPKQHWYLPALIVGGVTGAAGIHNLATRPTQPVTQIQPARLPGNATSP